VPSTHQRASVECAHHDIFLGQSAAEEGSLQQPLTSARIYRISFNASRACARRSPGDFFPSNGFKMVVGMESARIRQHFVRKQRAP
jgi:hypothetical protein